MQKNSIIKIQEVEFNPSIAHNSIRKSLRAIYLFIKKYYSIKEEYFHFSKIQNLIKILEGEVNV